MKSAFAAIFNRTQTFAIIIGLTDGILTALILAFGHLVAGTRPTVGLSLRIAVGSAICGVFVFFTAEYARLRGELLTAERQLNFSSHGQFVTFSARQTGPIECLCFCLHLEHSKHPRSAVSAFPGISYAGSGPSDDRSFDCDIGIIGDGTGPDCQGQRHNLDSRTHSVGGRIVHHWSLASHCIELAERG